MPPMPHFSQQTEISWTKLLISFLDFLSNDDPLLKILKFTLTLSETYVLSF